MLAHSCILSTQKKNKWNYFSLTHSFFPQIHPQLNFAELIKSSRRLGEAARALNDVLIMASKSLSLLH